MSLLISRHHDKDQMADIEHLSAKISYILKYNKRQRVYVYLGQPDSSGHKFYSHATAINKNDLYKTQWRRD